MRRGQQRYTINIKKLTEIRDFVDIESGLRERERDRGSESEKGPCINIIF